MEWYIFALLAPAFWAMNNVFMKYLITNKFKSYYSTIATVSFIDAAFAVIVGLWINVEVSFPYTGVALLAGLLPFTAFWFYSKAILTEEVSRVATLFQLIPLFVALLSVVFLNEILEVQQYIGIGLVILAATLVSYRKSLGRTFSGVLKFMTPFALLIAAYTIIDKYLLGFMEFWSVFFWNVNGTFCGTLLLLFSSNLRRKWKTTILAVGKRVVLTTVVGEGLYVTGTVCSLVALSLIEAPLASSFFALQPFYVFFYVLCLSLLFPRILKEEIGRTALALKVSAIVLMLVGTLLIV
ncbi:MAG: EamA family transporter [Candidatus Bathyarchaeota archaeon]|nr:EamA family transporter [Candidatus Bathyarchaeota archaeon]